MNPQVIGVSGVTGAGKTTLANALAHALNATLIKWDDFDEISISPLDYVDWYHRGKNYHEWDYSVLAKILQFLKDKQSILHPVSHDTLSSTDYIIFDAPLGRAHPQTGKLIDISIHIEVPMDVSLCRRILRDFSDCEKSNKAILTELKYYLSYSRPLFFDNDLKKNADIVIDGVKTTQEQIEVIQCYLNMLLKK